MSEDKKKPTELHKTGIPLFVKVAALVLLLIVIGAGGFFGYQYFTLQQQVKSQVQLSSQPDDLIAEVGKLIELPLNEKPTIATVSDIQKLSDQPFFAQAQNGDKVLIYQNAKKAILYRPSTRKIIDVGPVNIEASASAASSDTAEAGTGVTVALYNGTKRSGLTRIAETKLTDAKAAVEVLERENATLDYKETVVIDVTGKRKQQAQDLAKIVGGKIVPFPKGEATTSAEILIILGDNYEAE